MFLVDIGIVTHNTSDFRGTEKFGVQPITPKEFLQIIHAAKR